MSTLDLLPPGLPDIPHSPPRAPSSPSSSHLSHSQPHSATDASILRAFAHLPQNEIDGIRIHIYLLFYEDHALFWSSVEQHFWEFGEERMNRAVAWLEEIDAVDVTPAPPPDPYSPPDALLTLLGPTPRLPLPWPGSHIHSPQIPTEPEPLTFGWRVNLNEEEYLEETSGAVSRGTETAKAGGESAGGSKSRGHVHVPVRPGIGPHRATSMAKLKMGSHDLDLLSSLSQTYHEHQPSHVRQSPSPPGSITRAGEHHHDTYEDLQRYKQFTVTPPSSDRWMSEEPTPMMWPIGRRRSRGSGSGSGLGVDDGGMEEMEVEPYSLDEDAGTGSGGQKDGKLSPPVSMGNVKPRRASVRKDSKPMVGNGLNGIKEEDGSFEDDTIQVRSTWDSSATRRQSIDPSPMTPRPPRQSVAKPMDWIPLRLTEDEEASPPSPLLPSPADDTQNPFDQNNTYPIDIYRASSQRDDGTFDSYGDMGYHFGANSHSHRNSVGGNQAGRKPSAGMSSEARAAAEALDSKKEKDRLEELWHIAAMTVPAMPLGDAAPVHFNFGAAATNGSATASSSKSTVSAPAPPPPRPLPLALPAVLIPVSLSLILHPIIAAASASAHLPIPAFFAEMLPAPMFPALEASIGFSIFAFLSMLYAVPWMGDAFIAVNLKGRDMLKGENGAIIPETMGLPGAAAYIGLMTMFIPFPFSHYFEESLSFRPGEEYLPGMERGEKPESFRMERSVGRRSFPHQELALYLSAILSLLIATLLGFLDDVFDIRWRHKLPIPIIASIPMLMVYYAEGGLTTVVMPNGFRWIFGHTVNLGPLYYIYMSLLSTFSTNSINIVAGVNGLEVGQALVIALSVALNDSLYLPVWPRIAFGEPGALHEFVFMEGGPILRRGSEPLIQRHLLSLYFMGPLIGVCLGLLYHNWYPARAFVGDTFCYFAGMAFAVVAIQGHFSKTLLLFFIPQIFNFLLSCPQVFGLVPCPRHRCPSLDPSNGLLRPTKATFPKPPNRLTALILNILSLLRLTRLERNDKGEIISATNLTIMTSILVNRPMNEADLTKTIMWMQVACSALAFFVRYGVARLFYDGDRR